jgi:hypothetical protein
MSARSRDLYLTDVVTQNVVLFKLEKANLNDVTLIHMENSLFVKADSHSADQCRGSNAPLVLIMSHAYPAHIWRSRDGAIKNAQAFVSSPGLCMPLVHLTLLDCII